MVSDPIEGPNADEARYWASSGLSWIENQLALDTLMSPITQTLLDVAGLESGMSVLDVGCGTGAHALAAAELAGPKGKVLAVDISPPLIARATERAAMQTDAAPVHFLIGDAQTEKLPARAFDLATSRFGVMFFADPVAAFVNIARSVKSGGRMVFAAWGPVAVNPWWRLPAAIAAARLGALPAAEPNTPGPMGLSNIDYVCARLKLADIGDFTVTATNMQLRHPAGAAAMAALGLRVGPGARAMRVLDGRASDGAAIEEGLCEAFAPYEDETGFRMPATVNLIDVRVS